MNQAIILNLLGKYRKEFFQENIIGDWSYVDAYRLRLYDLVKPKDLRKLTTEDRKICLVSTGDFGYAPFEILYSLIREYKPKIVVETGVQNGLSTEVILGALEVNNKGRLISFDCGDTKGDSSTERTWDGIPGQYVREEFKHRWKLVKGLVQNTFEIELTKLKNNKVGLFHHDSDHSIENINYEMYKILPHLSNDGIIIMHDAGGRIFQPELEHLIERLQIMQATIWKKKLIE